MLPEELVFIFHLFAYAALIVSGLTTGLRIFAWWVRRKITMEAKRKKNDQQR